MLIRTDNMFVLHFQMLILSKLHPIVIYYYICWCSEIDTLVVQRKQLYDKFRAEQLAFKEQLRRQSEQEQLRRDQHRAAREEQRKIRYADYTPFTSCTDDVIHGIMLQHN